MKMQEVIMEVQEESLPQGLWTAPVAHELSA